MTERTPEHEEMLVLRGQAQAWIDGLLVGGMSENAAVSAVHLALVERALASGGVAKTASWLRAMARMVEEQGPALLAELRRQGH